MRYPYCLTLFALSITLFGTSLVEAQGERPKKKLIEYGWDVPEPDFVRQNIRQMEKRPFNGLVIRLNGGTNVFLHKPYDSKKFSKDAENLKETGFSRFTDNFILMLAASEEGWDWFSESDWKAAERNIRLLAQTARTGKCAGICFDPEPYGVNPWLYPNQSHAKEKSFEEYRQQVRRRGAQFIRGLQKEMPGVRVLTFFQLSLFGHLLDMPDAGERMNALSKEYYGLLPAFLNGMLDAAQPNTVIIDGNENAYYYTGREPFFRAYHMMRQSALALIDPKNRSRYALQVQAGQALYMDQLFALRQPEKGFISYFMTPEEWAKWFEHNVYYALYTTDEYVWCYSERMNWWQNQVPEGAEAAIRSARQKIEQGKLLGFGIEETTQAAEKRMQEKAESSLTRRKARIPKLGPGDDPPRIDGNLGEWNAFRQLEPFLPTLESGQTKTEATTIVSATYDDCFLYAAFSCQETKAEKLVVAGEKRDDPLWMGDVVELFISKDALPNPFCQFMVNPNGVQFDQVVAGGEGDLQYNPGWQAATLKGKEGWSVEVAIPWSAIGGTPEPGEMRRANAGRERKPTAELSTWSQVIGGFLNPNLLGEWIFDGEGGSMNSNSKTEGPKMSSEVIRLKEQFRGDIRDVAWNAGSGAAMPDEVDLSAMARHALNYLRGNPDPARGYECKFSLGPLGIPSHLPEISPPNQYGYDPVSLGDTDCRMDWQYAHMREMAGEPEPDPVEKGVRSRIRSYQGKDHLIWVNPVAYIGQPIEGTWATTWSSAKLMQSLAETYRRTGDREAKKETRAIFLALKKLALWDGDRAYYPGIAPFKDGKWLDIGWCADHSRNYPFIVEPCVRYWECTQDKEALDFARAVTEGFLAGSQPNQRELHIDPETGAFRGHVHLHTHAVWGVAHLGAVLNEPRYLEWARKAYEFVLSRGTDYGWYPESLPQSKYRAEICAVGDMVSTGVWLARGGNPHYWDQVERTVSNELRKSQFFLTPEFLALFKRLHVDKPKDVLEKAISELKKLEGGFVAQPAFDDWVGYTDSPGKAGMNANGVQMMGCCPPEGMRGLWEAWRGVVEERSEGVYINMALTRDHPAARVTAYRPEDGRLRVEARKAGAYFLRPPAWTDREKVTLRLNGRETACRWGGPAGAYVNYPDVSAGDDLILTWPVPSFTQAFVPASVPGRKEPVIVRWVGNKVVDVKPEGQFLPMF